MQRMSKMKNMRTALLFLLVAMISLSVSAQNVTVKGTVKDKTGETVIGASVVQKGNTGNGTITDIDGNFTLSVPANSTLVISYVGMKTQEIALKGQTKINVVLDDDSQALDEVVVIGYGTVQKKDLTGSVASVSAKQLSAVPVSNASEALQGKMAGVQITQTEGSPDADIRIRVRGGGSLSQDNSPLYRRWFPRIQHWRYSSVRHPIRRCFEGCFFHSHLRCPRSQRCNHHYDKIR